jgi:hypothetical protein
MNRLLAGLCLLSLTAPASAAVLTFTNEAAYLAKLAELGYSTQTENFEGPAWDGLRTSVDIFGSRTYHAADSFAHQGITWDAYYDTMDYVTTEQRFHALPGEDSAAHLANAWSLTAVTQRQTNEAFRGIAAGTLFAVGGWLDTNVGSKYDEDCACYLPKMDVFVRLDNGPVEDFGKDNALVYDPGNYPGMATRFFGIVDTDGFQQFAFLTDTGYGCETSGGHSCYYGPMLWADNFTFAQTSEVPLPPAAWMFASGLFSMAEVARRQRGAHNLA